MNRRGTSVALLVGVPATVVGASAARPAGRGAAARERSDLDPGHGGPRRPHHRLAGRSFQGALTDCVLAVVDGPNGKQLQLAGTLSGQGTNAANQSQPAAAQKVTGVRRSAGRHRGHRSATERPPPAARRGQHLTGMGSAAGALGTGAGGGRRVTTAARRAGAARSWGAAAETRRADWEGRYGAARGWGDAGPAYR